jgi:hypothetical protein
MQKSMCTSEINIYSYEKKAMSFLGNQEPVDFLEAEYHASDFVLLYILHLEVKVAR